MQIFLREFWTIYKTFVAKRSPSLPALAFQYTDFAVWQRQWLQGEVLESQLSTGRNSLANLARSQSSH